MVGKSADENNLICEKRPFASRGQWVEPRMDAPEVCVISTPVCSLGCERGPWDGSTPEATAEGCNLQLETDQELGDEYMYAKVEHKQYICLFLSFATS